MLEIDKRFQPVSGTGTEGSGQYSGDFVAEQGIAFNAVMLQETGQGSRFVVGQQFGGEPLQK
ncbi:MAG: hypothetical protein J2P36_28475 [Ktedonobacteraceae bacterium]|nr:hypothetical protein [Ktedonobacteraceae bacterium]